MFNRVFSNRLFQRCFYLIFLILWSAKLLPTVLYCHNCVSSIGISYLLLYLPIVVLLLAQTVFNWRVLWVVIFSFFIVCSLFILIDNFMFFTEYRIKMGSTNTDFILSETLLLLLVSTVDIVAYKIKPQ